MGICNSEEQNTCPGTRYGCMDEVQPDEVSEHVKSCPMARLAPFLQRQSKLLQSLQEQLTMVKVRNEVLETGFDKLNDIVNDRVLPCLNQSDHSPVGEASDIEEIERDHIPSAASQRDLLMPAHLRDMTPSPDPDAAPISTPCSPNSLELVQSTRSSISEGNEVSNLGTSLESHASSSSAAPSPNFRPQIRRLSGGSQERVKL